MNKKLSYVDIINILAIIVFTYIQNVANSFTIFCENYHIKYYILFLIAIFDLLLVNKSKGKISFFRDGKFFFEAKSIFRFFFIIFIITILCQIKNGFNSFIINEFLYIIVPLVFAIIMIMCSGNKSEKIINILFYWYIMLFFITNISNLTLANIKTISFSKSYSPFESGLSNAFYIFEFYYLVRNEKKKSFLSLFFTVLSLKRISMLFGILTFIIMPILKKMALKNIKINNTIFFLTVFVFVIITLLMNFAYQPEFANFIRTNYGIEINELTLDRYQRTSFIIENKDKINQGLGSTTYFLENYYRVPAKARNLHNDLLRILYECGIIGLISMLYFYFKAVKNNIFSFSLMISLFANSLFNHNFLGAGVAESWIVIYFVIYWINYENKIFFKGE